MALHGYAALLSVFPPFSPVIACSLLPLPILYLLPQRSDHLPKVFPLLIVIRAKLSDK